MDYTVRGSVSMKSKHKHEFAMSIQISNDNVRTYREIIWCCGCCCRRCVRWSNECNYMDFDRLVRIDVTICERAGLCMCVCKICDCMKSDECTIAFPTAINLSAIFLSRPLPLSPHTYTHHTNLFQSLVINTMAYFRFHCSSCSSCLYCLNDCVKNNI